jgi:hypothetical protein
VLPGHPGPSPPSPPLLVVVMVVLPPLPPSPPLLEVVVESTGCAVNFGPQPLNRGLARTAHAHAAAEGSEASESQLVLDRCMDAMEGDFLGL